MFYFARCMNIIFNSLLAQLVKYDLHTTRKIKSIHAIFITYYYFVWALCIYAEQSEYCLWWRLCACVSVCLCACQRENDSAQIYSPKRHNFIYIKLQIYLYVLMAAVSNTSVRCHLICWSVLPLPLKLLVNLVM